MGPACPCTELPPGRGLPARWNLKCSGLYLIGLIGFEEGAGQGHALGKDRQSHHLWPWGHWPAVPLAPVGMGTWQEPGVFCPLGAEGRAQVISTGTNRTSGRGCFGGRRRKSLRGPPQLLSPPCLSRRLQSREQNPKLHPKVSTPGLCSWPRPPVLGEPAAGRRPHRHPSRTQGLSSGHLGSLSPRAEHLPRRLTGTALRPGSASLSLRHTLSRTVSPWQGPRLTANNKDKMET